MAKKTLEFNDVELGATYEDKITGFKGIATGKVQYISGCNQILLMPKVGKDGTAKEGCWFDVQRCEHILGEKTIVLENKKSPGCDMQAPKK